MVEFHFEEIEKLDIEEERLAVWIEKVISKEQFLLGDVSIVLTNDEFLSSLNEQYLQHNYFTDVITFDYCEDNVVSGDIFISIDRVRENASTFSITFYEEFQRVVVHGVLHLLGYKDKEEKDKNIMTSKEDDCLKMLRDVN